LSGFILHHHDPSPYGEKIRKLFGVKGLPWQSVQVSMVMPRPDMTALTGGYRRIPVMQIGADIFCDTLIIARVIDMLHPTPSIFQSGLLANLAIQQWSDMMFRPGAALSLHENAEFLPDDVVTDRAAYFTFLDFENFAEDAPHFRSQFITFASQLNHQLADGRAFLFGDEAEWADINAYMNIWMAGGNIPSSGEFLAKFPHISGWYDRMDNFGCGERTDIESSEALEIAVKAQNDAGGFRLGSHKEDQSGCQPGDPVTIQPDDYGIIPVAGILEMSNDEEIIIRRTQDNVGEVYLHFPRKGFRVERTG
jgi:glutathione S-transferase